MNETLKTIATRYSCRGYKDTPLTDAQIKAVAEAAIQAPSAMNRQAWRIIMLSDRVLIDEIEKLGLDIFAAQEDKSAYNRIMSRGGKIFYNAPVMAVVAVDPSHPLASMDCGIVCENIALATTSLGLGNVICGMACAPLNGDAGAGLRRKLQFPEGFTCGCAVLLGTPADAGKPHEPDQSKIIYI